MPLRESLEAHRNILISRWVDETLATYSPDARKIFGSVRDRFRNPVGETIQSGLTSLYDGLVAGSPPADLREALDGVVRLRSVQDFSAAAALGFLFRLKKIIHEEIKVAAAELDELRALFSAIDELALLAFDLYMECREQVYQIRANEAKARNMKLFERANRIVENHAAGRKRLNMNDEIQHMKGDDGQ
jgi:hypothetical protein